MLIDSTLDDSPHRSQRRAAEKLGIIIAEYRERWAAWRQPTKAFR
jgi:hypothetical protein